jgi:hypothetical protein
MNWTDKLNGDSLTWLVNSPIPEIRNLALGDLLDRPEEDPQRVSARQEAYTGGTISLVLSKMMGDGYWQKAGPGYGPKYKSSVWSVTLLGQLGARVDGDPRVDQACQYILDHALAKHGQMSYNGQPSGTFDCLQGNLCWALMQLGCTDPRLDLAFDWIGRSVTGEGVAPATDKKADRRYYAYKCQPGFSCGANNKLPCAWGAAKLLMALSKLSEEKRTPIMQESIKQGVDLFLGIDPVTADYPRTTEGKPNRDWWLFGFPVFYITDLLQVAEALTGLGLGNDPRMASLLAFILAKQDDQGRWNLEYNYGSKTWGSYGRIGKPNEWVTLRAQRVIKKAYSD